MLKPARRQFIHLSCTTGEFKGWAGRPHARAHSALRSVPTETSKSSAIQPCKMQLDGHAAAPRSEEQGWAPPQRVHPTNILQPEYANKARTACHSPQTRLVFCHRASAGPAASDLECLYSLHVCFTPTTAGRAEPSLPNSHFQERGASDPPYAQSSITITCSSLTGALAPADPKTCPLHRSTASADAGALLRISLKSASNS